MFTLNPYKNSLLAAVLLLAGCSGSEDLIPTKSPPSDAVMEWTAVADATHEDVYLEDTSDTIDTRSLFIGGNTDRFGILWDQGDNVDVYQGETYVGTLSPSSSSYGLGRATLSGTLSGSFSVGDNLSLYLNGKSVDFTGQNGTVQSASSRAYATRTVSISRIDGSTIYFDEVALTQKCSYVRFYLTDMNTGERLHPKRLELLSRANGKAMLKGSYVGENVVATESGDISIDAEKTDGEYNPLPYISMLSVKDASAAVTFLIKATLENGDIYLGPIGGSGQGTYSPGLNLGRVGNCRRQVRKTVDVATTLSVAAIADKVFTGSVIEPDASEVIVKDSETVLTQGTDYGYSFSNNLNVGEATVTVTGLADAGTLCTTPYLGSQARTFNIVKATPVVEITTDDMMLVYDHAGQDTGTRVSTRVFIDNNGNGTWDEGTDYDITSQVTVTYTSANTGVCTVDAGTGLVTAAAPGATTVSASLAEADNWTSGSTSYAVKVITEVSLGNSVTPWTDGGTTTGKVHAGY